MVSATASSGVTYCICQETPRRGSILSDMGEASWPGSGSPMPCAPPISRPISSTEAWR